ncbi:AAA family ATPase [Streptococcus sp. S784/96/1]|uniref:AAA family ATPase n=1 Tax=Streptococcus sp. S784/96/1 TaxID=2653499 RepID=UPI00192F03CB|nr:AAA family ATPase [Streptococcus sp. S784/96/1]
MTILVIQGGMAVGKTTVVNAIKKHFPFISIINEDNRDVIEEIRRRNLDKNLFEDYIKIQRLWLQKEIERWEKAKKHPFVLMDYGPEEIEFHTLYYPNSIGKSWNVEKELETELSQIRQCVPDGILFLEASIDTLRARRKKDATRQRGFFEHYTKEMLPLKKEWLLQKDNVDFLDVDNLSKEEVEKAVLTWCQPYLKKGNL